MKNTIKLLFLLLSISLYAQTGTIRGVVKDKQSEMPLYGASVQLLKKEAIGTTTDEDGFFVMKNIKVGRQSLKVSYLGYELFILPEVEVTSGKDVFVDIKLQEAYESLGAVVIETKKSKDMALNKMATVSARQFSMDEVTRFSGGRGDVGRLASNFAGVSSPDDSRNDIVVRGNSPTGLLWRLEGVPILSPNHYATAGTTGGPVSAVNANLLKSSDFFTSAFPSEYGNALGGVFDLGFRNGNIEDYEFTAQMGAFTGFEAMAEGPIGQNNGSFLIAGRYSVVGLFGVGGAGGTSAVPNYKDLSFNLNFGDSKLGTFSVFGILADSDIDFIAEEINEDDLFSADDENAYVTSCLGIVGLKHQINLNKSTFLRTTLSTNFSANTYIVDRFLDKETQDERLIRYAQYDNSEDRHTVTTLLNSKINRKLTLRGGVVLENHVVKLKDKDRGRQADNDGDGDPDLVVLRNTDEQFMMLQSFFQTKYRLTKSLTINTGFHTQYSSLNGQTVLEPRLGASYKIGKHLLSFGYGLHHQPVAYPIIFLNELVEDELMQTNRDLDFVKSNHFVAGYDIVFAKGWRAKAELYYQAISNAAVELNSSSYSTLTEGADFGFSNDKVSLVNNGSGYNQGMEFTLEKFFSKGFYGLFTASFFESKYKGSDGIERNTPFNNQGVVNLLAGKEFKLDKNSKRILFFDTKFTYAGGRFYTPIDLENSQLMGYQVDVDEEAYSLQNPDYFRWDLKFGMKFNSVHKKRSHRFYIDIQNVTNKENIFVRRYNRLTNRVNEVYQIGFFPDVGYKFQF